MRYLGFDLASRKLTGVVLGDEPTPHVLIPPSKIKDRARTLGWFSKRLEELFEAQPSPFYVFVEAPLVGRAGPHATIVQAQVESLVLAQAILFGAENAYPVNVKTWKKTIAGNGGASKSQVAEWLEENHPLLHKLAGGDQDLVDAACIALYCRDVVTRGIKLKNAV